MPFPNNLPQQLASFIGREQEITEVKRLLTTTRLLTLTGIGGAGKTRLSLQVATDLLDDYPNGVWFVDLAKPAVAVSGEKETHEPAKEGSEDSTLVSQAVASALGIREEVGHPLVETISNNIGSSQMLVLLDNCEHLIEACAAMADILLPACPNLRILATSRQALGVTSEVPWPVPPLSLPDPRENLPIERMLQCDAVQLFIRRATLRRTDFTLTPDNAQAVAQLCFQLDGIPLAIELAAARINVLPVEAIVDRLDERFRLLSSHSHMIPHRHQTLTALMDWSYDLLLDDEQVLLRSLSVFAGGFTGEAVGGILDFGFWILGSASGSIEENSFQNPKSKIQNRQELLSQLVDKSLVIIEQNEGQTRYKLLETVRQYAWQKLRASRELDELRAKHAIWYLDLAERAEPEIQGPHQAIWLHTLETEHDNLRAVLLWTEESGDVGIGGQDSEASPRSPIPDSRIEIGLRISAALRSFWAGCGYWSEGRRWLGSMLSRSAATHSPYSPTLLRARAKALQAAGWLANWQNDYASGTALLEESLTLSRQINFRRGIADALHGLAWVEYVQGHYEQVKLFGEEGLALHKELGDEQVSVFALEILALAAMGQGELERATDLFTESLDAAKNLGNKASIASLMGSLGEVARAQGDYAKAGSLYQESLAMSREAKNNNSISIMLANLGSVAYRQGDPDAAEAAFMESVTLAVRLGDKLTTIHCLVGLAGVLEMRKQPLLAAQLLGRVDAMLAALGTPLELADRIEHEDVLATVRAKLGEATFDEELAKGRAMTTEQAVAIVESAESSEEVVPAPSAATTDETDLAGLTTREIEVLRLVANGLTNPEVAHQLNLSVHTVEAHLRTIFSKIGVTSRNAAAHYAHENKIL